MKPIFSDDPQAIEKLKTKIKYLEHSQEHMKNVNANYKKHGMEWALKNVSHDILIFYAKAMQDSWNKGRIYPAWALTNNSATIRQAKKRLEQLLKKQGKQS